MLLITEATSSYIQLNGWKNTNDAENFVLHIEISLRNAKSLAISFKQTALLEKAEEQKISSNILIQSF